MDNDILTVGPNPYLTCPSCLWVYLTPQLLFADYFNVEVAYIDQLWESFFKKVETCYCPRCGHFWGDKGEKIEEDI